MRIVSAVAATLLLAGVACADPPKADPQDAQAQTQTVPVVLASADTPHPRSNEASQPAPGPGKRPNGRTTHCRCGDPQPGSQSPDR